MDVNRPLDFLVQRLNKEVLVSFKDENNIIKGKLIAFDHHLNLLLEVKGQMKFYSGNQLIWVENG